jgi:GTP-binding protein
MTGDTVEVNLDLRFHADILFIGYPNAGKSSMLNQLTKAHAKVAAYPFTTLEPQLGRMGDIVLMDLPGLIDGTHVGKGLGTNFVKHTESSMLTAHFVSLENEDAVATYTSLRSEIGQISEALYKKREVVILSKKDESTPEKIAEAVKQFKKLKITPIVASVLDDETVELVRDAFTKEVTELRKLRDEAEKKAEEEKMTFVLPTEEV